MSDKELKKITGTEGLVTQLSEGYQVKAEGFQSRNKLAFDGLDARRKQGAATTIPEGNKGFKAATFPNIPPKKKTP